MKGWSSFFFRPDGNRFEFRTKFENLWIFFLFRAGAEHAGVQRAKISGRKNAKVECFLKGYGAVLLCLVHRTRPKIPSLYFFMIARSDRLLPKT